MAQRTPLQRDGGASTAVAGLRSPADRGRVGVYAALGASVGALPLPWIPDSLARRVRGALVHDVAVRHGLSLTNEARAVLADPWKSDAPRGVMAQAVRFVGVRLVARTLTRFGPLGALWPARNALLTFALGHLFDRYLATARTERAVRIDLDEARRVRAAIDAAVLRALSVPTPAVDEPTIIDDQRDATTALVDGLLGVIAGVPGRLLARLEEGFDEALAQAHG